MEERRDEKTVLYGKRLQDMDAERLTKVIAEKLKESGNIGWIEEWHSLVRKYDMEQQVSGESSIQARKKKVWRKK